MNILQIIALAGASVTAIGFASKNPTYRRMRLHPGGALVA